jgi:tRNA-specific 2-thiouridylase
MEKQNNKTKKVFVGLSGGVDSSVSALLLKEQGYDVVGVFIKAWHPDFLPCNWRSEMRDAMRICAKLDIPFLLCDLEKEYKKEVIDYLINEYSIGRTPNPDVFCNKEIKFGHFLNWVMLKGADFIATGHYAQNIFKEKTKRFEMLNAVDTEKDQTYFLWTLKQDQLEKVLFPIGHLLKKDVRKIAQKNNLNTATKKDSQGLCFLGHVNMKNFLKRFIDTKPGDVLNESGEIIGRHEGSILYTIGERHGFIIFNQGNNEKSHYVINKNIDKNTITVSDKNLIKKGSTKIILQDVSFTRNIKSFSKQKIQAKIRYRGELLKINLDKKDDVYYCFFEKNIFDLAEGQSIVFYSEKECLGGAIIKTVF